jgi:hypothetical protein
MERALADETAGAFNNMINPKSPTNEGNRPRANSNTKRPMSYAMADQIRQKGEKAKEKVAERGQTYIHPKNKTKIRWDMYCGALIIYSVCVIPWRIGEKAISPHHEIESLR